MAFKNRIRVPLVLKNTQFPTEEDVFTKSNGESETISVIISKTYQGETDNLPEQIHQRIIVALSHDVVNIESDRYVGRIVKQGAYSIAWPEWLNYPLGKASFVAKVTPFNASNFNCATCNEYQQLSLTDDEFYGDLEEGEETTIQVFDNDSICCSPFTATVISYNLTYVESLPTINQETGVLTLKIKDTVPTGSNILLATYRVTCANGEYDDANIYADVNGSIEVCQPVTGLGMDTATETTASIFWVASPSLVSQYKWSLFLSSNLGTPVQTGNTTDNFVNLSGLLPGTNYTFIVYTDCVYNDEDSEGVSTEFATIGTGGGPCGSFTFTNEGFPSPATVAVSYFDCNGVLQHENVSTTLTRCLLMSSPGNPVYLSIHPGGSYAYNGLCDPYEEINATIGATEIEACTGTPGPVYISQYDVQIETGVQVYLNSALSILAGSGVIKSPTGVLYYMTAGLVGFPTGNIC